MTRLILASKSKHRAKLLKDAGVDFESESASIDERSVEKPVLDAGMGGVDVAEVLAQAKALEVSERFSGVHIIGCDQTLTLDGQILHKPEDMEAARRRLLELSGKTHQLNSAVSIALNNEVIWSYVVVSHITFEKLDPGFVGRHLALVGDQVLSSVGAYQIEGPGIQLMEKIDGDYFSIIGLPLLPLLKQLRNLDLLDH